MAWAPRAAVFTPFLEADKIINPPIAKHHVLTGATLGMKNGQRHLAASATGCTSRFIRALWILASFMLPTVTLIDCYRVLLRNGPTGGNLEDVATKKTMVAGNLNPVALDAYWNSIRAAAISK